MRRAKFNSLLEQREFFINVKKKLKVGSKRLSKKLGLKSRGSIESYTFMRTSPPISIVKKLESLTGIKANYKEIDGKVYRKKRGFIPMKPKTAEDILRNKFKKDISELINLIKSNLSIKEIMKKIRDKGYTFDNSEISRCIGAYRTNLLSRIVKKIVPDKNEVVISSHIRRDNKTLSINFNLAPLYKLAKQNEIMVGIELSKDRKNIRIFPLTFGRKLISSNGALKILLTEKSGLEIQSNVKIILNPESFGFNIIDSIYDKDGKIMIKEALKEGFTLDKQRSTPHNHKGDLSLYLLSKNIIIEVTRAISYKGNYFKIGQCFIQKKLYPKSIQFLVCRKKLLTKDSIYAFNRLGTKIVYTNFGKKWEKETINKIKKMIKNGN